MTKKRLIPFAVVLVMLFSIFSAIPSAGATSTTPVKLIYATPNGVDGIGASGYIEVENIAYEKNVTVHYSYNGIDWYDCSAQYYKPTHGNYEAWSFATPGISRPGGDLPVTVQFAIKYEVNGNTYWDNNNGNNYKVYSGYHAPSFYDFGCGGVKNYYSFIDIDNNFTGAVQLKNLGYEKDVKVVYSTDNWKTTKNINASFEYTSNPYVENAIEVWHYSVPVNTNSVQYRVEYTVNGTTYVDDNFGANYTVTK